MKTIFLWKLDFFWLFPKTGFWSHIIISALARRWSFVGLYQGPRPLRFIGFTRCKLLRIRFQATVRTIKSIKRIHVLGWYILDNETLRSGMASRWLYNGFWWPFGRLTDRIRPDIERKSILMIASRSCTAIKPILIGNKRLRRFINVSAGGGGVKYEIDGFSAVSTADTLIKRRRRLFSSRIDFLAVQERLDRTKIGFRSISVRKRPLIACKTIRIPRGST